MSIERRKLNEADVRRELAAYEKKYGMTSDEFVRRYRRGDMGDSADAVEWMGLWRMRSAMQSRASKSRSA